MEVAGIVFVIALFAFAIGGIIGHQNMRATVKLTAGRYIKFRNSGCTPMEAVEKLSLERYRKRSDIFLEAFSSHVNASRKLGYSEDETYAVAVMLASVEMDYDDLKYYGDKKSSSKLLKRFEQHQEIFEKEWRYRTKNLKLSLDKTQQKENYSNLIRCVEEYFPLAKSMG